MTPAIATCAVRDLHEKFMAAGRKARRLTPEERFSVLWNMLDEAGLALNQRASYINAFTCGFFEVVSRSASKRSGYLKATRSGAKWEE